MIRPAKTRIKLIINKYTFLTPIYIYLKFIYLLFNKFYLHDIRIAIRIKYIIKIRSLFNKNYFRLTKNN